ncbi:T. brucei spp.-specific protein [Trypanosoma brucei gambiense DAL972]|uniref:T. brucei spp.-specific protein n=1 Tax=Trypanosoma brucei gambiense (strain MHOM/CI/86/DAL972) TaxID=679716 RepID=C9ZPT6_TRYB9|nr:T. brucei spp.-specific protein [Trypanosoma brucei gambiense DAL972]CBH11414.1 T. brucei spp.-specific protein [Trypanosoma brucei gambiense DAL972]|eukprot:XP_011773701.1 T. brucei spp.-specific protein [Trypanosoma brucei gambiense DAL972]
MTSFPRSFQHDGLLSAVVTQPQRAFPHLPLSLSKLFPYTSCSTGAAPVDNSFNIKVNSSKGYAKWVGSSPLLVIPSPKLRTFLSVTFSYISTITFISAVLLFVFLKLILPPNTAPPSKRPAILISKKKNIASSLSYLMTHFNKRKTFRECESINND